MFEGFPHIISAKQFSREWLENKFFPLTDEMQAVFDSGGCEVLKGKRMVSLFYQPSTRTRMSFEMAMDYLGGKVVFSSENARESSSAEKGETLRDTLMVVNRYKPDVLVIRYDRSLDASLVASASRAPVLNAGDREPGEHPTQALLEARTILKRRGAIDGLKIAIVGDLKNSRTVRSLCYILGMFKNIQIYFVSPTDIKIKDDVKEYLHKNNVAFEESTDLRTVAPKVDAVYQTRTQKECGGSIDRKDHNLGYFLVDKELAESMKPDAIIMHPLPREDEITLDVDSDSRSVYLTDQIDNGVFARMTLLKMILS